MQEVIEKQKEEINNELERQFSIFLENSEGLQKEMIKDIREFTLRGGKRIRGMLVINGYKAYGGKGKITEVAAAVELLQSFLLIHDDIIDRDELRRGKPTLHKIYQERYGKPGKDLAIIAGDMACSMGQKIILDANLADDKKNLALKIFNQTIMEACHGESLDILAAYKKSASEEEIAKIHKLKTAIYTFEAPLKLGGVLAGENNLEGLSKFAILMGEAYQIRDDIIGVFGDEKKTGKPIGGDIKEGKKTLLILKAMQNASIEEKEFLDSVLGNSDLKEDDVARARDIIIGTSALEYSEKKSQNLLDEARDLLGGLEISDKSREFLQGLIDYLENRSK